MNVKEYNTCVEIYSDRVYRFVVKNLKDDAAANDIVQDTYLKLWEKKDNVDYDKAKSYIFTAAYHTMIDYIRKNKRMISVDLQDEANVFENNSSYSSPKEFFDLKSILNKAVDMLPKDQKTVILLRDYEGYSYKEIADITNLSEAQVKVYIYRARLALKNFVRTPDLVIG